jgi:hypothetical protein
MVIEDSSAANRSRYLPFVFESGTEVGHRLAFVLDTSCQPIEPLETLSFVGVT